MRGFVSIVFQSTDTRAPQVHGKSTWNDGSGNVDKYGGHITSKPTDSVRPTFKGKIKDTQKYTGGIHAGDKMKLYFTCDSNGCKWQEA